MSYPGWNMQGCPIEFGRIIGVHCLSSSSNDIYVIEIPSHCYFQDYYHFDYVLSLHLTLLRGATFLKVCHQSDPLLDRCMKESFERLRPFLRTGIPELSIPSVEPLVIPEITMNQGKGSLNLQTTFGDLHLWGLSVFELRDFHAKLENNQFRLKMFFPHLTSKSWYRITGKILMLPIAGNGFAEGNYTDVEGVILIQGSRLRSRDHTYFRVDNVAINLEISHVSVYFDNLFNGDKELGDAMNTFLNDNWKHVMKDMKPVLEESIGQIVKELFNSMYNKIPFDEVLPW